MAVGGIINSLWDMWARLEQKPVWKLLVDMNADEILSLLDFRYFSYSTFYTISRTRLYYSIIKISKLVDG